MTITRRALFNMLFAAPLARAIGKMSPWFGSSKIGLTERDFIRWSEQQTWRVTGICVGPVISISDVRVDGKSVPFEAIYDPAGHGTIRFL